MTQISLLNLEFDGPAQHGAWTADLSVDKAPLGTVRSVMPGHIEFLTIEEEYSPAYVLNICEAITLNSRHLIPRCDKPGPVTLYDLCAMEMANIIAANECRLAVVVDNAPAPKKRKSNVRRVAPVLTYEHDDAVDLPLARAC